MESETKGHAIMSTIPLIDTSNFIESLKKFERPYQKKYYAMFSSYLGGIVTDPCLMLAPVDDHLVHRGDGVFESMKCVDGAIYNLNAHMQRLAVSAENIECSIPGDIDSLVNVIREVIISGKRRDCCLRVIISRGPGSFAANPYESVAPQTYVIAYRTPTPFMEKHPEGATAKISSIPVKTGKFATVKSCNYLPNALMKKEAADKHIDFVFSIDSRGFLGEGATESVGIVSSDGGLLFPNLETVLRGTTAGQVMKLAEKLVSKGLISSIGRSDITLEQVRNAREIVITGTTCHVASVTQFEGRKVGTGSPGPVSTELNKLLSSDMCENDAMRTSVFSDEIP